MTIRSGPFADTMAGDMVTCRYRYGAVIVPPLLLMRVTTPVELRKDAHPSLTDWTFARVDRVGRHFVTVEQHGIVRPRTGRCCIHRTREGSCFKQPATSASLLLLLEDIATLSCRSYRFPWLRIVLRGSILTQCTIPPRPNRTVRPEYEKCQACDEVTAVRLAKSIGSNPAAKRRMCQITGK